MTIEISRGYRRWPLTRSGRDIRIVGFLVSVEGGSHAALLETQSDSVQAYMVGKTQRLDGLGKDHVMSKKTLENEIIKRRNAEETLRLQGRVLEQLVCERTAELQKVNQNLNEEIVRRIKVEETLRQTNEALESQVFERTRQLMEANEALQEKRQGLVKFHDFIVGRELKMIEQEKEMEALKALLMQEHPCSVRPTG